MALFLEPVTRYWLSEDTSQHRMSVDSSAWREGEANKGNDMQGPGVGRRCRLHAKLFLGSVWT